MNRTKILGIACLMGGIVASILTSCGGGGNTSGTLQICVYDGGYGEEWVREICADYEEKTGVHVNYTMDINLLSTIENQLQRETEYDIFISHDINWQSYAANGYLANLDDLYSREVEGTNKTFAERLVDGALENSVTEDENGEEHYYKVCYTQGVGGLVYNVDLFEANGWEIPETYAELAELCEEIASTPIPNGDRGETYAPFAWSGADRQYYWDYIIFPWWYELAGAEKIETILEFKGEDGKYRTGYEMYNPDTYYKEFIQAYEMWYNLIALSENNYSIQNAYGANLLTAQSAFISGKAAMIPYGQWAKYEIIKASQTGSLNFDIKMMKTPKANASTTNHVNYQVGFGDSMVVAKNSPYVEEAKDFLCYLATYDASRIFVEKSQGAFLAFDYSDLDLSDLADTDSYIYSMSEIITTCDNFNLVSRNPITYWNTSTIIPWIENDYYYQMACSKPAENTPEIVGDNIYRAAQQGWNAWCNNAGFGQDE